MTAPYAPHVDPNGYETSEYTYRWADPEQTQLIREGPNGVWFIGASEENPQYQQFLESNATAAPYVAPEPVEPPTAEQKLASAGLTVDELKQLLDL